MAIGFGALVVFVVFFTMFRFSRGVTGPELVQVASFESRETAEQLAVVLSENDIAFLLTSAQSSINGTPEGKTLVRFRPDCVKVASDIISSFKDAQVE